MLIGSVPTGWCGLGGVGVALLKEVCHWRVSLGVSEAQARPSVTHLSCCLWIQM